MVKMIETQQLQPGMVILRVTQQNGPVKVKKSGLVTSQAMVQGLIEMGIQQVEIDPEQTVEVQTSQVVKSTTRQMFESHKAPDSRIDDGLSEQFHRSLFLPSVQDIPSAWQFYARRYGLAVFIGLGGLGLGWTLANSAQLIELISTHPEKSEPIVLTQSSADKNSAKAPTEQVIEPPSENVVPQKETNSTKVTEPQSEVLSNVLEPVEELVEDTTALVQPDEAPPAKVSPELLARFEKALTEVEDQPVTEDDPPPLSEQSVPRIDQLPAWVMTRLPNMAFSAHMYASDDAERWVRVNGSRMVEGDMIDGSVEIISIEPQHVILSHSGQEFSMAALTDW